MLHWNIATRVVRVSNTNLSHFFIFCGLQQLSWLLPTKEISLDTKPTYLSFCKCAYFITIVQGKKLETLFCSATKIELRRHDISYRLFVTFCLVSHNIYTNTVVYGIYWTIEKKSFFFFSTYWQQHFHGMRVEMQICFFLPWTIFTLTFFIFFLA